MDVDELMKLRDAEAKKSQKVIADLDEAIKARGGTVPPNGTGESEEMKALTRQEKLAEEFGRLAANDWNGLTKLATENPALFKEMSDAKHDVDLNKLIHKRLG